MPAAEDPYLIPGSQVLRNRVGARTAEQLLLAENDLVTARFQELNEEHLTAQGTLEQLRWIHHYLFQDVYDLAGQVRTIDMSKGGGTVFQPLRLFNNGAEYAERTLRADCMLVGLKRDEFVKRLSVHYDNFNMLHPFREGNGRTQRVFWTLVARDAGWGLDWPAVSKSENDRASILAHERVDYSLLEAMFARIAQPLDRESGPADLTGAQLNDARWGEEQPILQEILSEADYQVQRRRLSYQLEGDTRD
ncbi:hypothetical protein KIMH_10170 [Bombiscardovia apis]|uniref:protein adenylyltransferase n=1 Tax=Bombiscardovia apis TaxID=2932182 RepID=A0ABN6SIX4_9BIFI|nr:Fic family protein [Bombiscardovia apis]BDR54906.1 hypothetical protein KIMH_10170 [Bombiscardovia apis]